MPDGQLKSHLIRVYVTRHILASQNPRLQLLPSHVATKSTLSQAVLIEPSLVCAVPGMDRVGQGSRGTAVGNFTIVRHQWDRFRLQSDASGNVGGNVGGR